MSTVTGYRISPQQAAGWQQHQRQGRRDEAVWLHLELHQVPDEATLLQRLVILTAQEEILRTRLHVVPGMTLPVQVIEDLVTKSTDEIPLELMDWQGHAAEEQARLAEALRTHPEHDMPLRVWRVQIAESRWALLLKASASHLDLTSLSLVAQWLTSDSVAEDRLQYADYAEWKHSLLEDEPDNPGLAFWRQQRPEMTTPLLSGLENAASTQASGAAFTVVDSGVSLRDMQQRASSLGITVQDYLYSAWCILLGRLRGQTQLQLAWIDDGRGEGLESSVGLFEQALPVQAVIDPALPLLGQLDTLLKPMQAARGWRDYYDSANACEGCFAFRRYEAGNGGGTLRQAFAAHSSSVLGLDCLLVEGGKVDDALHCRLVYDSTRFNDTAIACLSEQWRLLLQGLGNVEMPVGSINLQGEVQQRLLIPAPAPGIEPISLPELIERQALTRPHAPALADNNGILSYGELSARANQLARCLLEKGVQPGGVVGLLLPRGNPMIIAMLAVLKAGGAYLPLDTSYPADRLAYMVQDSDVQLVVTFDTHRQALPDTTRCLLLDESIADVSRLPDDSLAPLVDLRQPAYLIYTSGSTGQPKAVEISHANLTHSTQVRMAFYGEPVQAYLLLSSFAFDSSVAGIFWTLAQGGLLVLPASGEELDLGALTALIRRHRVSHSLSLPSLYETLLDYADRDSLASLSTWIVAGEACAPQVLAKHRAKVPQARLVNEYGPTEATVWATADILTESIESGISIGRPIPTMQLWLINEQGVPAAIGEPGEIHLGGPTLASGYRGRPDQTAQAFVSSSAIAQGARRYKTGDLARWRLDGRLDFLGRADHQVKIRGYRVELGEIERLLTSHSEVREAAVIAQDLPNGKRLLAYVTDRLGYPPDAQALSNFLSDRLPPYMVPSAFVHLKEFPRTPNGKLDLKALPAPDQPGASTTPYLAPRNEMETELAAICAEVLRRERIGVLDNFFQNGGDSIQSLQIVARAHQRGIRLTAKQVFESETIERMAKLATRLAPGAALPPLDASCRSEGAAPDRAMDLSLAGLDEDGFQALLAELEAAH